MTLDMVQVTEFVNQNIDSFHQKRLAKIQGLKLNDLIKRKNPYLFRAKNITSAAELVASIADAIVSSSEETLFGKFLEETAIFINGLTFNGQKSSSTGLDLDFNRDGIRYLVAIKSGRNWGNSSQHSRLEQNFKTALKVLRQESRATNIQAVLGICYGNGGTLDRGNYLEICGQSFWEFISGESELYVNLVNPLGYEAQQHNERYVTEQSKTYSRLAQEFSNSFCDSAGQIDWAKLVSFNSSNRSG